VDAIWINPGYPSPMADAGYDVPDYRAIDPRLGTAHRRPRRRAPGNPAGQTRQRPTAQNAADPDV
jgi:hypothetical protein